MEKLVKQVTTKYFEEDFAGHRSLFVKVGNSATNASHGFRYEFSSYHGGQNLVSFLDRFRFGQNRVKTILQNTHFDTFRLDLQHRTSSIGRFKIKGFFTRSCEYERVQLKHRYENDKVETNVGVLLSPQLLGVRGSVLANLTRIFPKVDIFQHGNHLFGAKLSVNLKALRPLDHHLIYSVQQGKNQFSLAHLCPAADTFKFGKLFLIFRHKTEHKKALLRLFYDIENKNSEATIVTGSKINDKTTIALRASSDWHVASTLSYQLTDSLKVAVGKELDVKSLLDKKSDSVRVGVKVSIGLK